MDINLETINKKELQKICRDLGITIYQKLKKNELIYLINEKNNYKNDEEIKEIKEIKENEEEEMVFFKKSTTHHTNQIMIETDEATHDDETNIYNVKLVKHLNYKKINIPKPILKWVGGKTQILDKLIMEFPVEMHNYHEIFLGGGSVLLTLLSHAKNNIIKLTGNVYAYDLNEPLIYVYKNIQLNHNELYDEIQKMIVDLNLCNVNEVNRNPQNIQEAKMSKENYYYWIRSQYNKLNSDDKKTILGSAMFIFLNKTCFRGVFRVGPRGFNVPYGHYNNPEIINREHLNEIHNLIQNVVFESCNFNVSLNNITPDDYVYLDPPYAPETETSFVGYTENGFNIENHNELFNLIHQLTKNNKKIMMSNSDVKLVRDNFINSKYEITSILCKRSINSKNPDAKAKEVIIKNY
jgi:DNA adenine methylase